MVARGPACVLALTLAVGGCYDLERLDPGPETYHLLIDDFEDGDNLPSATEFSDWRAFPFKEEYDRAVELELTEGNGSDFAYVGDFELRYPVGGGISGISLGISGATRDPVDARVFRKFHFSARLLPDTPFPEATEFYVQLGCDGAPPLGTLQAPFFVQQNVPRSSDWITLELSLDAFGEPDHDPPKIKGGTPACLAVVDSIRFTVSTYLAPTEVLTFLLFIDDVYFE